MPRVGSPYGPAYERRRADRLRFDPPCELRLVCDGDVATSLDHEPPLGHHVHVEGSGCCTERPACMPCQRKQGGLVRAGRLERPTPPPSREWL